MSENLEKLSITDTLTNLYNRRKIDIILNNEYNNFLRYNTSMSICILDIDNFKMVNDTFGHSIGDEVLKDLANIIKQNCRQTDSIGRWGGEEFIIMMPHTKLENAVESIKKIKEKIAQHHFNKVGKITCSFGVCEAFDKEQSIQSLFNCADSKLYFAKENGKDQIVS